MRRTRMIIGCRTVACAAMFVISAVTAVAWDLPNATVQVRVVDDSGAPVTGVDSELWSLSDMEGHSGKTDREGLFSCRLRQLYAPVSGAFTKAGYYRSQGAIWSWSRWGEVPTNTLTVVLKRVIDPVPMVRREVETHLPRLDTPVGFDLEAGDWVAPDGKGVAADVWMTGAMRFVTRKDHEIRVLATFSNVVDGIREFRAVKPDDQKMASDLTPPHVAPPDGYARELALWQSCEPDGWLREHDESDRSYLFRVRTKVDEEGRVVEAKHGWTNGEIAVDSEDGKRIWMRIRYYYNPDPKSRSLEPKEIADRQGR